MNKLIALFLLLIFYNPIFSQKKEYPPEVKVESKRYNVVYDENASYTYILNTEKIKVLKPETTIIKVLTFKNEKLAYLSMVYVPEEVQLVDHDLNKTNFKRRITDEIPLKVNINYDKIVLTNKDFKQNFTLKIMGEYDNISLKNIKTGEIFISNNPVIKNSRDNRVPLYKSSATK